MATKRKRVDLDLSAKIDILKQVDEKVTRKNIADKFGIDVSSVSKLVKNRDKIERDFHSSLVRSNCKRRRASSYTDIERALLKWFKQTSSAQVHVCGPMLAEIAERFAKEMDMPDWKCSNGFLERFKKRHNITFKVTSGEAGRVNTNVVNDWISRLPKILDAYNPNDIFNMDETGMFYKLLPNRSLFFRDEKCHDGRLAKERLTVVVCCNMSGTEKIPLLVIGKSRNPRCFNNVKSLPVTYKANQHAWMTSELFEDWVISFDNKMNQMNRKVVLFVDNCPAHTDVANLMATKLVFLPPNTTSVLQPCDQGIIYAFKQQYRKRIVRHVLHTVEEKQVAEIDIMVAVNFMHAAWNSISQSTIMNCFHKSQFSFLPKPVIKIDASNICDIPLDLITDEEWAAVSDGCVTFDQFVSADDGLLSTEMYSVEEIAASCSKSKVDSDAEDSDDDVTESLMDQKPPKTVSYAQSVSAFETLRSFIYSMPDVKQDVFSAVSCLNDFLIDMPVITTQCKITHFFTTTAVKSEDT